MFQIIIQVIRSKFIAVLLGPAGMGIAGLLTSTTGLISSLTNFGLGTSAVKDVAAANATGNNNRIAIVVTVLRRWVWITGLLGAILTLFLSPWLSQLTFGNRDYTVAFIWLSVTLLFQQLSTGQQVLLQGMRKLQHLAKASMTGSLFGLFISVPIYYFYGIDGIVPAIILSSITTMFLSWYFASKVAIHSIEVTREQTITEGKEMLKMGFMISLSGLIGIGVAFIVRIFISHVGGVAQVGLYNAGFAIINTYVGMVFTAMSTDYYPRLAGVVNDRSKTNLAINQQAEIAILILAPILVVFLVFINWIVILLYSAKFIAVSGMIHWAALGMFFKAASWSIGFVFLAKGATKLFFVSELIANVYMLLMNIMFYKYFGLNGIGFSFMIGYILLLMQVFIIAKIKYAFAFDDVFYKIFTIQLLIGVSCFLIIKMMPFPYSYIIGTLLIIVSALYSLKELDKRIGLKSVYHSLMSKISKR